MRQAKLATTNEGQTLGLVSLTWKKSSREGVSVMKLAGEDAQYRIFDCLGQIITEVRNRLC